MARLNLTIPDLLYERLDRLRDRVNVSKICATALAKELDMIEGTAVVAGEAKVQRLVQRFLRQRETKELWYRRGRQDGEEWAVESASLEELQRIGEQWDEGSIEDCESLSEIDPEEFPTLDVRPSLERWVQADVAEGVGQWEIGPGGRPVVEADVWREYLRGWYHRARDLWRMAKPALQ